MNGGFEGVFEQCVECGEGDTERNLPAVDFVGASEGLSVKQEVGVATIARVGGDVDLELEAVGLGIEVVGWAEEFVVGGGVDGDGRSGILDLELDLILAGVARFVGDFCGEGDVAIWDGDLAEDGFSAEDGAGLGLWATFAIVEGEFDVFAGGGLWIDADFDGFLDAGCFGVFVVFGAEDIAIDGFVDFNLEALRVNIDVAGIGEVGLSVGGDEFQLKDIGPFGKCIALEDKFVACQVDLCGSSPIGGEGDFAVFGGVFGFATDGELEAGCLGIFVLLCVEAGLGEAGKLDACGAGGGAATVAGGCGSGDQEQGQPSKQREALEGFLVRDTH